MPRDRNRIQPSINVFQAAQDQMKKELIEEHEETKQEPVVEEVKEPEPVVEKTVFKRPSRKK